MAELVGDLLDGDRGGVAGGSRRLDVDAFLSHRISLDEVNTGFELMEAQDGIRSVISFS